MREPLSTRLRALFARDGSIDSNRLKEYREDKRVCQKRRNYTWEDNGLKKEQMDDINKVY